MIWPLLMLLALALVAVVWHDRPHRAQAIALLVTAVGIGYAWLNLGRV
ncbi:MAG: hypothetical protein ABSC16_09920 [Candidatus Dormibacteria bacterium]